MESTPSIQPLANADSSGYFVWEPAGKKIAVQLGAAVVDHLNYEIMRGFGAVPKRGAEVGGLLLGTVERAGNCVVRVEEFVNIPCEHLHGPSYVLSEKDLSAFDRELAACPAESNGRLHVVGFFRSNTRELMQLSEDDQELLNARFPGNDAICLLVRPFATRPSEAVLLTREDGRFSGEAQSGAFVFRRKEMHLAPTPRRERGIAPAYARPAAPEGSRKPEQGRRRSVEDPAPEFRTAGGERATDLAIPRMGRGRDRHDPVPVVPGRLAGTDAAEVSVEAPPAPASRDADPVVLDPAPPPGIPRDVEPALVKRSRWVWAPLCFVFLVLGILIGAGSLITMNRAHRVTPAADPYALELSVSRFGESFHLAWNPGLPALRQAQRAELLIEEGGTSKTQQLSADDLSRGGIIYRGAAAPVRFRLTLFLRGRAAFSETVETQSPVQ
jgi:hypothetical protein